MKRIYKAGVGLALGAALITGSLTTSAVKANALSGNCHAWLASGVGYAVGKGRCSRLAKDTKARVTLDLPVLPDRHSRWFIDLNVTHKTPQWSTAGTSVGLPRGARVDYGSRR